MVQLVSKMRYGKALETFSLSKQYIFVHPLTEWEGQVFGIGCQIFRIAGPVILYGIFSSWVLGLIYWILKMLNII